MSFIEKKPGAFLPGVEDLLATLGSKKSQEAPSTEGMERETVVVLGLGNILYADEGIGVRVAEQLYQGYEFPERVTIVDGGTQGLPLLSYVEKAHRLLILDAVEFGLPPGELVVRRNGHIPAYITARKMSVHQNSFSEVLALAELRDALPTEIVLVGMQPVSLGYGGTISEVARMRIPHMTREALRVLESWGVRGLAATTRRELHQPCLSLRAYEAGLDDTAHQSS